MKNDNLGIVLANSAAAKIYRYDAPNKSLILLSDISSPKATYKVSDIVTDGAGQYQKSTSSHQGSYESQTDPKTVEAEKFAVELAKKLDEVNDEVSKLIIIAPGHFQSLLKNKLKKTISDKIDDFFDKDYTKLAIKNLEKQLTELLYLRF